MSYWFNLLWEYVTSGVTTESYGYSLLIFLRNFHMTLHNDCATLMFAVVDEHFSFSTLILTYFVILFLKILAKVQWHAMMIWFAFLWHFFYIHDDHLCVLFWNIWLVLFCSLNKW